MLTGDETEGIPLHNQRLLERFRDLETIDADDQDAVIKLIDAMIMKGKMEEALHRRHVGT